MYEWWGVSAIKKGSDENSKHKNTTSEIKNYPDRLVQQMGQAEEGISEFEDRKFLYKNEKRRSVKKNPRAVRQYQIAWYKWDWVPEGEEAE